MAVSRNVILMSLLVGSAGVFLTLLLVKPRPALLISPSHSSVRAQQEPVTRMPRKIDISPRQAQISNKDRWGEDFKSTQDYFDFVSKAAKAAFDGGGRAAFYVSKAVLTCSTITAVYGGTGNPEAALNAQLENIPSWAADLQRRKYLACRGFFTGDPFAALPSKEGNYNSSSYWMDQSYKDDDPIAQSFHAASAIAKAGSSKSTDGNSVAMATAQSDINNAIASGDPAALFEIGVILSDGHGSDPLQGYALSIAACELGYDCSADTNTDFFGFCVAANTCPAGSTYSDVVSNAIGQRKYADAYAIAQQIQDALSRGDAVTLQEMAKLKPNS